VEITGSIAIEKYFDLLMFVMSILVISSVLPGSFLKNAAIYKIVAVSASVFLILAILLGPWIWRQFFSHKPRHGWFEKIAARLDSFIETSLWLRKPAKVLPVLMLSIVIWLIMGLTNSLLFTSLGLSLHWQAAGLVMILVYFGVLPALMPGNLGPFTYFAQLALLPFSVESSTALAFAVILYVLVNLPVLLIACVLILIPKNYSSRVNNTNRTIS
jgi:uncharacterized membrane protein YbhN (UPF0104 family)